MHCNTMSLLYHTANLMSIFFKIPCFVLTAAEGYILGVGAKIFTIAGPVIMYGTVASVVYGVIYWVTTLF